MSCTLVRRSAAPRLLVLLAAVGSIAFPVSLAAQKEQEPAKKEAPADRLEQLEKIRQEFAPADSNRQFGLEDRITVSGAVTTADGSPLPQNLYVGGIVRRPNYTGSLAVQVDKEGRFTQAVDFGRIFLYATAPEHAPALLGPLETEPGGKIEDVRVTLDRGFTGKIRLLDDQGRPLPGAKLHVMYLHGEEGNAVHVAAREATTNDEGIAILEHCAAHPLTLETETAGFQHDRKTVKLQPDAVAEWKLTKAKPATGVVVSRQTQEPIAGAEVRLIHRDGPSPQMFDPHGDFGQPPLLATTDPQGRFTLDTLRDDTQYAVVLTAADRGGEIVSGIRSGKEGLRVELGPPRYVRGKVVGDLSRLEQRRVDGQMTPFLRCLNPVKIGTTGYHYPITVPVEIHDGEGRFEIRNLLPGTVRLDVPGQAKTLELVEAIDDVVIELEPAKPAPAPGEAPRRKVVLQLKTPAGEPAARGELTVRILPSRPSGAYETKALAVKDNRVEFEAGVPCRILWETDNLVGYWIKEEQIELAEGPDPLVKEIEAVAAGALYGQVREQDGSPCRAFSCTVWTVSPAPQVQQPYLGISLTSLNQDRQGRFVVGPLPLGGTYRVEIHGQGERTHTRAASEDVTLTREEPVRHVELKMPEGVTVAGQVVDPNGNPVPGVEVRLGHRTANRSNEGASLRTDSEGAFRFPHVNAELPGSYYLHIQPQQTYRGQQVTWRANEAPLVVRLQRGWSIEGVLVEHRTGKVVPGATLYARPMQFDQRFYLGGHETRTDARGRFRFDTLEPIPYRFYVNGMGGAQGAPPWEADPRAEEELILSGDVQQGADLVPVPPPPEEP